MMYVEVDGMGAAKFTGLLPQDVASLTLWQLERDFFRQRHELAERLKKRAETKTDAPDMAEFNPTRAGWVAMRESEGWTTQDAHDEFDRYLKLVGTEG